MIQYQNLSCKKTVWYAFIVSCVGNILNKFGEHRNFYINQYSSTQKIDLENKNLETKLIKQRETEVRGSFKSKIKEYPSPMLKGIISVSFISIYIFAMFKIGCLEHTPTGIYGGILGAIVFAIGIQAYLRYFSLLYFAYDLKRIEITEYFFIFQH